MDNQKNYHSQIEQSIDLLVKMIDEEDLTPFKSYVTAIGELIGDGVKYQLQMRIVKMESRLSMDDNGYRIEEITKVHE